MERRPRRPEHPFPRNFRRMDPLVVRTGRETARSVGERLGSSQRPVFGPYPTPAFFPVMVRGLAIGCFLTMSWSSQPASAALQGEEDSILGHFSFREQLFYAVESTGDPRELSLYRVSQDGNILLVTSLFNEVPAGYYRLNFRSLFARTENFIYFPHNDVSLGLGSELWRWDGDSIRMVQDLVASEGSPFEFHELSEENSLPTGNSSFSFFAHPIEDGVYFAGTTEVNETVLYLAEDGGNLRVVANDLISLYRGSSQPEQYPNFSDKFMVAGDILLTYDSAFRLVLVYNKESFDPLRRTNDRWEFDSNSIVGVMDHGIGVLGEYLFVNIPDEGLHILRLGSVLLEKAAPAETDMGSSQSPSRGIMDAGDFHSPPGAELTLFTALSEGEQSDFQLFVSDGVHHHVPTNLLDGKGSARPDLLEAVFHDTCVYLVAQGRDHPDSSDSEYHLYRACLDPLASPILLSDQNLTFEILDPAALDVSRILPPPSDDTQVDLRGVDYLGDPYFMRHRGALVARTRESLLIWEGVGRAGTPIEGGFESPHHLLSHLGNFYFVASDSEQSDMRIYSLDGSLSVQEVRPGRQGPLAGVGPFAFIMQLDPPELLERYVAPEGKVRMLASTGSTSAQVTLHAPTGTDYAWVLGPRGTAPPTPEEFTTESGMAGSADLLRSPEGIRSLYTNPHIFSILGLSPASSYDLYLLINGEEIRHQNLSTTHSDPRDYFLDTSAPHLLQLLVEQTLVDQARVIITSDEHGHYRWILQAKHHPAPSLSQASRNQDFSGSAPFLSSGTRSIPFSAGNHWLTVGGQDSLAPDTPYAVYFLISDRAGNALPSLRALNFRTQPSDATGSEPPRLRSLPEVQLQGSTALITFLTNQPCRYYFVTQPEVMEAEPDRIQLETGKTGSNSRSRFAGISTVSISDVSTQNPSLISIPEELLSIPRTLLLILKGREGLYSRVYRVSVPVTPVPHPLPDIRNFFATKNGVSIVLRFTAPEQYPWLVQPAGFPTPLSVSRGWDGLGNRPTRSHLHTSMLKTGTDSYSIELSQLDPNRTYHFCASRPENENRSGVSVHLFSFNLEELRVPSASNLDPVGLIQYPGFSPRRIVVEFQSPQLGLFFWSLRLDRFADDSSQFILSGFEDATASNFSADSPEGEITLAGDRKRIVLGDLAPGSSHQFHLVLTDPSATQFSSIHTLPVRPGGEPPANTLKSLPRKANAIIHPNPATEKYFVRAGEARKNRPQRLRPLWKAGAIACAALRRSGAGIYPGASSRTLFHPHHR